MKFCSNPNRTWDLPIWTFLFDLSQAIQPMLSWLGGVWDAEVLVQLFHGPQPVWFSARGDSAPDAIWKRHQTALRSGHMPDAQQSRSQSPEASRMVQEETHGIWAACFIWSSGGHGTTPPHPPSRCEENDQQHAGNKQVRDSTGNHDTKASGMAPEYQHPGTSTRTRKTQAPWEKALNCNKRIQGGVRTAGGLNIKSPELEKWAAVWLVPCLSFRSAEPLETSWCLEASEERQNSTQHTKHE